ncbi:MAG: FAD-dependent oxidoreductase, partial [Hyphomicrobium sp.]
IQNLALSPKGHVVAGTGAHLKLVKGSHIVVSRISNVAGNDAYILQNKDGRVIFILPFEKKFHLIGTTDVNFDGDLASIQCSEEEEKYLLEAANLYLQMPLTSKDILWRFSGVRPLKSPGTQQKLAALSRDYHLELQGRGHGSALLTIIGGKVTTYRRLSEEVLEKLRPEFPFMGKKWTEGFPLPGGNMPNAEYASFLKNFQKQFPWLPPLISEGLAQRHGMLVEEILNDARNVSDLGSNLGYGLCEREVLYFKEREWAHTAEDVLWRRTKVGLHLSDPYKREEVSKKIEGIMT